MNVSMFLHVGFLVKPLAAVLTWIRSRVRVDKQMRGQSRGSLEAFAALLAFKDFLSVVDSPIHKRNMA